MTSRMIDRRTMMAGGIALSALAPAMSLARRAGTGLRPDLRPDLRIALLGQSLIQQDVCAAPWPGRAGIAALLEPADAVFTDLETAILSSAAGAPTRQGEVLHAAPPVVIDCLRGLGVSIVATSNNHAWDLGTPGIGATLAELEARRVFHAGSGPNLASATKAAVQPTRHGGVALVAAAAGAIRDGAAATPARAGVNELRRGADGALEPTDVARTLDAIRDAHRQGNTVIAYLHNHYWEKDPAATPEWQRTYARQCIDAGAAIFVAHGPPLLQGIERYKGAPLLHGLGSLIFQTRKTGGAYGPANWQSLIVDARFRDRAFVGAQVTPVLLDESRATPEAEYTKGVPAIARGDDGRGICKHVAEMSALMGNEIAVRGDSILL
ncbi:MAG: CapA family protein [Pseudomonadota bacterium]|jgi:poly-gamma-glutamate synthesis protein (capsule biosynthesis protein)